MGPDRVGEGGGQTPQAESKRRFAEHLTRRRRLSGDRPGKPRSTPARSPSSTQLGAREASRARDVRGTARTAIETAARARQLQGTEATLVATERLQTRNRAVLQAEVAREAPAGQRSAAPAEPVPAAAPVTRPSTAVGVPAAPVATAEGPLALLADAGTRAERALALVEKVELLLRSGRPALSVSLRTREPARVELQRVGRATVSLRLAAARPLPPDEVDLLRTALATRGLRLRALEWVPLSPPDPGGR